MQTQLFILAVAMIGVPTSSSSIMDGRNVMNEAYDDMIGGAYSIQMTHWRPANCPNEEIIHWGMIGDKSDRQCGVCICNTIVSAAPSNNCNLEPCFRDIEEADIAGNIKDSWKDASTLSSWESVQKATAYQLYNVSDGICYLTGFLGDNIGRRMKCFTNRFYTPK